MNLLQTTVHRISSRLKPLAYCVAICLSLAPSASTDTIYFNRGAMECKETWEDGDLVYARLKDDSVVYYMKNRVLRIEKGPITFQNKNKKEIGTFLDIDLGRHRAAIKGLFFTSDGRFIVSCSRDKTIRVWHIRSGQLVRVIRGWSGRSVFGAIGSAALFPDSRRLAVGVNIGNFEKGISFGTLRIFDIEKGELVSSIKSDSSQIRNLELTGDGKRLISFSTGSHPCLFDVNSGRILQIFKPVYRKIGGKRILIHTVHAYRCAISKDGERVIAGGNLWDARNGSFIANLKDFQNDSWSYKNRGINEAFLRRLNEEQKKIYRDPETGEIYDQYWSRYDGLWRFTPDGRYIMSKNQKNEILLWDGRNGKYLKRIGKPSIHGYVNMLQISSDGKTVMTSRWGGPFRNKCVRHIYRFSKADLTLVPLKRFKYIQRGITAISPDGRFAATGFIKDSTICLWDMETGEMIKSLGDAAHSQDLLMDNFDEIQTVVETADGYADLAENQSLEQLRRAAVADAKRKALNAGREEVQTLLDKDLKAPLREILWKDKGSAIKILKQEDHGIVDNRRYHVRVTAEIFIGTITQEGADNLRASKIWGVGFSQDGRYIAWGKKLQRSNIHKDVPLDQSFQLFDTQGRPQLALGPVLKGDPEWIRTLDSVGEISIRTEWNTLQMRKDLETYKDRSPNINNVYSYTLTPDGGMVIGAGDGGRIHAHRTDRNEQVYNFVGHTGNVWGLAVSPDGKLLVSGSDDQTVKLWSLVGPKGYVKPILSILHGTDNEWVAWAPDGYYMSSVNGDRYIGWQFNRGRENAADFYSALQFERVLYRPDIIYARLNARTNHILTNARKLPEESDITDLKAILPPKIRIVSPEYGDTAESANIAALQFSAEKNSIEMLEYSVFVNGMPVVGFDERFLTGSDRRRFERRIEVPLFEEQNRIRIEVFNGKSMGMADTILYRLDESGGRFTGDLYLLAVGINTFTRMPEFNLNYAARDAESIANEFTKMEGRSFKQVFTKTLTDNSEIKPTRENILQALSFLRPARANDTVIIFLASHGFSDSAGNYYFVPSDASFADTNETALTENTRGIMIGPSNRSAFISWESFFEAMRAVAGKRLLIVDTCQAQRVSGTLDIHSLAKRSFSSSFALLVAARGSEYSQEYPPGKHGLFTYALLNGLNEDSDTDGDGQLTLNELYKATASFVERKRDKRIGSQRPQMVAPWGLDRMELVRF
jgi:WD40 repeat protein